MKMLRSKFAKLRRRSTETDALTIPPDFKGDAAGFPGGPGFNNTRGVAPTIAAVSPRDAHRMKTMCVAQSSAIEPPSEPGPTFKIRFADSEGRRRSASFLVEQRYAWRGYKLDSNPRAQQKVVTLSAFDGNEVVATISIGADSDAGLFVDALFRKELTSLRLGHGTKRKICEFTKLAVDEAIRSKEVLAALFHIAYIHARKIDQCSDLVVEVNPRHVRFYEKMLGFRVLGDTRVDIRVGAPATLMHLDLEYAQAQIAEYGGKPELYKDVRSLYPLFFSEREETGIEGRLLAYGPYGI